MSLRGLTYDRVPKTKKANLRYRRMIWKLGHDDENARKAILDACRRDILLYINLFCWTYDPRKPSSRQPFITYGFQDDGILEICDAIKKGEDIGIDKSRDMGVTWISLAVIDWHWRFRRETSFLCLSQKEDRVDKKGDPDCLFWKLDYIEKHLPTYLKVRKREHTHLHIINPENGSVIDGESTNPNAGRGGRRTAVFRDEEAFADNGLAINKSIADNTPCQIRVSTPNGTGNSFYLAKESGTRWLSFHWSLHPEKRRGLYSVTDGVVEILDRDYKFPPGYDFQVEAGNKIRSVWYDKECKRRASAVDIAQELDIDYLASGSMFFDQQVLALAKERDCRKPLLIGNWAIDGAEFLPANFGQMSLWAHLNASKLPDQQTSYSMGVDISAGTGASDSCISIVDCVTGDKVCEYVCSDVSPERFAKLAAGLARFYSTPIGDCYIVPEGNGPGTIFLKALLEEEHYTHIYRQQSEAERSSRRSTKYGWWSGKVQKQTLLADYRQALASGKFVNHSTQAIIQAEQYIFTDGGVEHSRERGNEDASANKEQHGDRVIADALACRGMGEQPKRTAPEEKIEYLSLAWRKQQRLEKKASMKGWLDE